MTIKKNKKENNEKKPCNSNIGKNFKNHAHKLFHIDLFLSKYLIKLASAIGGSKKYNINPIPTEITNGQKKASQ